MKIEPLSKCCGVKIDIRESGVSQMSFDVKYYCSKCKKELHGLKTSQFNW